MIKRRLLNLNGGKRNTNGGKRNILKDTARQVRMGTGGLVRRVETDDGAVEAGTGPTARQVGGGAGGRAGVNTGNWTAKRRSIENGQ